MRDFKDVSFSTVGKVDYATGPLKQQTTMLKQGLTDVIKEHEKSLKSEQSNHRIEVQKRELPNVSETTKKIWFDRAVD